MLAANLFLKNRAFGARCNIAVFGAGKGFYEWGGEAVKLPYLAKRDETELYCCRYLVTLAGWVNALTVSPF